MVATLAGAADSTPSPFDIDLTPDGSAIETKTQQLSNQNAFGASSVGAPTVVQNPNPDISFVGDFVGANSAARTQKGAGLSPTVTLREIELDGVGYVSPWARAKFVASFDSDGGTDVEEANMEFFKLPSTLTLKVGKMLVDLDTLNPLHQHGYPFVDKPLVEQHAFGTDPLKTTGANTTVLLPNPWDHYLLLSLTAGMNPDRTNQYSALYGGDLNTPLYAAKLATSFDLASASYLNFNFFSVVSPITRTDTTTLYGGDMLVRYSPDPTQNALTFLNGYLQSRGNPNQTGAFKTWGYYSYLGWQFSPNWRIGARYDHTSNPTFDGTEKQYMGILTFFPTETNYVRLQAGRHLNPSTPDLASAWENQVWLQVDFGIGPHQPHTAL